MIDYEDQFSKKKFLDNLFESKLGSHIQTEEQSDYKLPRLPIDQFFSFKAWMGTLLSFFLLSYMFSFNLLITIPLIFIGLLIYSVLSLGYKHLADILKIARKYIKIKYFSNRNFVVDKVREVIDLEKESDREYKLMEI
jgi:hypothetical protein